MDIIAKAEKYTGNENVENDSKEKLKPFEGCMPIEDMLERGLDTPRFGPLKPKGLTDPKTGRSPYAVMQLRQDDRDGTLWSLVGMQTRMKRHEQEKAFRSLPGLKDAEFVRYGSFHRNTFIQSPACLQTSLAFKGINNLFFAGQITGVEGYVESTACGLAAGINARRYLLDQEALVFPKHTAIGCLLNYITEVDRKDFQPMNVSFGLIKSPIEFSANGKKLPKKLRRQEIAKQALDDLRSIKIN
jgi:methylenetetrahydrofolate--tRNA-(uracil-5-)-methyltransferase